MVFNRGEFSGLTVESAADNQRQLAKLESKENVRRSRDLWREKSNMWVFRPGMIYATGAVSVHDSKYFVRRVPSAEAEMSRSVKVSRQAATKSAYARKSSSALQNAFTLLKPRPPGAFKSDLTTLAWKSSTRSRSSFPLYLPLRISPVSPGKPPPLKVQSEKSSRLGSCPMISSTWVFVIETNFIDNERMEGGSPPMLEIHSRFSHFPPTKVRSRTLEKYGM